jgi:hypothetical protein
MLVNAILKGIILLLGAIFVTLQGLGFETEATGTCAFMLLLLTGLYCTGKFGKPPYFLWFLVSFTVAHILSFVGYFQPPLEVEQVDYFYYGVNLLYILSYIFLILKILVGLDFRKILVEFSVSLLVLIILDIFCVVLVTAAAENELTYQEYLLEFAYNGVIMTLLSVALLNYMYRNDSKSMMFLLASICLVFSEIIQLAYFYILEDSSLGYVYSLLFVVAFILFYIQSQKVFTGPIQTFTDEQLKYKSTR